MKLIRDINSITAPLKNTVITIGNFDGVHIGHQALFHSVIEKAKAINGTAAAMTFDPHPLRILKNVKKKLKLISATEEKVELISDTGLDVLIIQPFTLEFADITAEQFVCDILVGKIGVKAVIVGEDYSFGKNREGNIEFLKAAGKRMNFEVMVADWIMARAGIYGRISSTRIRGVLADGDVVTAKKLTGRFFKIRGIVQHGRNRGGNLLGFPTANVSLKNEMLCPKTGVYAVFVNYEQSRYLGVANIGYSPTFEDNQFTLEVHILDFSADIYDKKIEVSFIERIRGEINFPNPEELSEQIEKDVLKAGEFGNLL